LLLWITAFGIFPSSEPRDLARTRRLRTTIGMRKRFFTFTFERESYWIVALLLIPLLGILLGIVLPGLWKQWFP
jgi:hypothetical protein